MRIERAQNICQEQDAAVAAAELAQIKADQDYISMMTGVEVEEETEEMSYGQEV
nr:MAG TPA: hypothetical protein [Caudoviricetes sp.]